MKTEADESSENGWFPTMTPAGVEDWFEGLALENRDASLGALSKVLSRLTSSEQSVADKFAILEYLCNAVEQLCQEIRSALLSENPIFSDRMALSTVSISTQQQLVALYVQLIESVAPKTLSAYALATAILRALFHLQQLQIWFYQNYCELPGSFWRQVYFLYQYAREANLLGDSVPIHTFQKGKFSTTIDAFLKQILMLSLSNTNRFSTKEVTQTVTIIELFEKWIPLNNPPNSANTFCFNLAKSAPPTYKVLTESTHGKEWTTIATDQLIDQLSRQLGKNRHEMNIPINGAIFEKAFLLQLRHVWRAKPIRQYPRMAMQGFVELRFANADFFEKETGSQWTIINKSEEGYCVSGQQTTLLTPGTLLLLKAFDPIEDHLASLRWIRTQQDAQVQLGIELLLGKSSAVHGQTREGQTVSGWMQSLTGDYDMLFLPKLLTSGQEITFTQPSTFTVHLEKCLAEQEGYRQFTFSLCVYTDRHSNCEIVRRKQDLL